MLPFVELGPELKNDVSDLANDDKKEGLGAGATGVGAVKFGEFGFWLEVFGEPLVAVGLE
jgi:hypothetical protein